MRQNVFAVVAAGIVALLSACSVMPPDTFPREGSVDIERYMGAWYVIAHIPPDRTRNSYNSIERYRLTDDGRVATRFTYREGGFDGELVTVEPTGHPLAETNNAVWGMEFFWPLQMEYTISYVDPDYETTIIARSERDWVWIMARTPQVPSAVYEDLVHRVAALGYDTDALRRVPQQPLDQRNDLQPE